MAQQNCPTCGGQGKAGPCKYCNGAGGHTVTEGGDKDWAVCGVCGGGGIGTCPTCSGSGSVFLASLQFDSILPALGPREQKPGRFQFAGVWTSKMEGERGTKSMELVFQPPNRFSQKSIVNKETTHDVGTYQAGAGYLHFFIEDHEPKVSNGRQVSWPRNWTYFFTVLDENTMVLENRISRSKWTLRRK